MALTITPGTRSSAQCVAEYSMVEVSGVKLNLANIIENLIQNVEIGFNSTTNSTYPMRKHGYRLHLRQPMHYYPTVFSVFVILQINVFSALSS